MEQTFDLIQSALDCLLNQKPMPDLAALRESAPFTEVPNLLLQLEYALREQKRLNLELESQLKQYAYIDSLTGVSNRRAGLMALQEQIAACAGKMPLSLAFVDLDGLKQVNDRYGHAEGDRFIRRVSRALLQKVRGTDTVARVGGDEFIVIMPGATEAGAMARMQEILRNLLENAPVPLESQESGSNAYEFECPNPAENRTLSGDCGDYSLAFSFGVATVQPEEWTTAEDLLRTADQKMYECKRRNHQQWSGDADWSQAGSESIRLGGTLELAGVS